MQQDVRYARAAEPTLEKSVPRGENISVPKVGLPDGVYNAQRVVSARRGWILWGEDVQTSP